MELTLNFFSLWPLDNLQGEKKGDADYICICILGIHSFLLKNTFFHVAPGKPLTPDSPSTIVGAPSWSLLLEPYVSVTSKCNAQGCSP